MHTLLMCMSVCVLVHYIDSLVTPLPGRGVTRIIIILTFSSSVHYYRNNFISSIAMIIILFCLIMLVHVLVLFFFSHQFRMSLLLAPPPPLGPRCPSLWRNSTKSRGRFLTKGISPKRHLVRQRQLPHRS